MKQVLSIAKGIGILIGTVTVLYGAFRGYDNIIDNQEKQQVEIEYINVEQTFLSEGINEIKDSISKVENELSSIREEQESHHEAITDLGWMMRNQDVFTPEQMELLLDEWSKKNNETVYEPLPTPSATMGGPN